MSQESFEKSCTELRPNIQKNKTRFGDPTLCYFFGSVLTVVVVVVKKFRCFVFTLEFPRVYSQTENHTELAYLVQTNGIRNVI